MATIQERIDQAKVRLANAQAALSDEDRAEQTARDELARVEAETEAAEQEKRKLDLDRRLDAAKDSDPNAAFRAVGVKGFPDTFIIKRSGKAHAQWTKRLSAQAQGKQIDPNEIARDYALAVVYDWNGVQDFDKNADSTSRLRKFLTDNPGVVTPLTDAAAELAGVYAAEFKSGG
jgi:hypothetical protein